LFFLARKLEFFKEILAYIFIGLFVILPIILKLKKWISRYENNTGVIEMEIDILTSISSSEMTLRVPENGGVE
jgi:hypothetical protein